MLLNYTKKSFDYPQIWPTQAECRKRRFHPRRRNPLSKLDNYYQACEDAIRCQAKKQALGVAFYLSQAAQLRDELLQQYKSRLELGSIRGVQDYWENTLMSLPYAERTGRAAIYLS
jgi:hypothetical protein